MRLRELHIRNIASIERADIDFEHGLNDAITGTPASIFLISGDTGAGKSVILDCISMALYKNTPRIAGVANVMRNDYTAAEGEQMRVASIEQYTRLGISPKDECYSEVVFEGNDGRTCHARLTLGLAWGKKGKETGVRPIRHNRPVWEIRIDGSDWMRDSVEQTVLGAVGLDFQQFGRMAMLAQGQFANFLTGDKKEREAILEQLTDTQHFTAYGEAIKSLWTKARDTQRDVQTRYDAQKPHTLTDEQVELYTKEQADAQVLIGQYQKDLEATDGRLKQVEAVLRNEQTLAEAEAAKRELEARKAGEAYCQSKALFSDWDATTAQRQQLASLTKARQEVAAAQTDLGLVRETFLLLTADFADRQAKAKAQAEAVSHLQEWVDKQARHEELYTKAGETELKIRQYTEKLKKASALSTSLKQEKDKTDSLKTAHTEACASAQAAEKVVKEKQGQIDELSRKRLALKPQEVNEELRLQNTRRQQLTELQTAMDNLKPVREEYQALKEKLLAEEETLKALREARDKADADYQDKRLAEDKASKRLTTMKMSLDEKIKVLRHRLKEEHTEVCPLCGQHIGDIHLDDDFRDVLTPLEEEEQQAKASLRQSETLRVQAMGNLRQLEGTHQSNQSRCRDNEKRIARAQQANDDKAVRLGLDLQKDLLQQIAEAVEQLAASVARLETAQREAERLQSDINRLTAEKMPSDTRKTEADMAKLQAEAAVKNNAEAITRMEKEYADLTQERETLKADISAMLADYCGDWQTDTEALLMKLKDDAWTFAEQRKLLNESRKEQEKTGTLIATLTQYSQKILLRCPDWDAQTPPQAYAGKDINTAWTELLAKVNTLVSKVQDARAVIASAEEALADYYQATGKTEQSLQALIAQEPQVAVARKLVGDIDSQMRSRADAIAEAHRQIDGAFRELGLTERAELPDKQALEEHKTAVGHQRDEAIGRHRHAKDQLELHQRNIRRLQEIAAELEAAKQRFVRWDRLNNIFGGTRFRTLVQTYILRPLLNNANIYLEQITDRYRLTCSEANEQLSILVLDRYNKDQVRSVTVLSGGERFMISLALSLALSSLNRPDMNVNILFIDEGFGTLDEKSLDSVMSTLEKLQEIAGQTNRRVGIISHREELEERIPVKIQVVKRGEGRSSVEIRSGV